MKHKVLIVEDQPDLRKLIRMTLEFGEYDIHEASDGEHGLLLARLVNPKVIILDVMMPGQLDGFQVCRCVKEDPLLKGVLVVMLTARGQLEDISAGELAGADAYFIKPFSPIDLIDRIDELVASDAASREVI
ncbi:MAG: response regulator receiver protein [Rhizobacter sp.]|nr:response regulator receiver protein [Rhizobacter sp.]